MTDNSFKHYVESKLDSFVEPGKDWRVMTNMERFYYMHCGHASMHEGLFLMAAMESKRCLKQLVDDYKHFLTPKMFLKLVNNKDSMFHQSQHSSTKNYFDWLHEWEQSMEDLDMLNDEELSEMMVCPTYDNLLSAGFTQRCAKYADSWNAKLVRKEEF